MLSPFGSARAAGGDVGVVLELASGSVMAYPFAVALTELFGGSNQRTKRDLSRATQVRIVANVVTGFSGGELRAQYSTDNSTWAYMDGAAGPTLSLTSTGQIVGSYVNLASAAKADVYVRFVTINGDGATDVKLGGVQLQAA